MAEATGIEWADSTFNPWVGCTKISPACDNCYAEGWAKRAGEAGLWSGTLRRTSVQNWNLPRRWNREAAAAGAPRRVFCASLADVFDNQADPAWRADLWRLIRETPALTWFLLTKRPQNVRKMLPPEWGEAGWPNVWLGTTAEDEEYYLKRWRHLSVVPAPLRFLSYEPALGPLGDLRFQDKGAPDWLIVGGESGPGARPMHPAWAREVRDQCSQAGVPFMFKQWGDWLPEGQPTGGEIGQINLWRRDWIRLDGGQGAYSPTAAAVHPIGKKRAGRLLDGVEHIAIPTVAGTASHE
ncbi:phage Gp37/Gp68 family protein [Rhodovarius crocodyli]|uniref:Phage Gp37/Gp68 family protein n=1 Tax=Rhodovarius crocodyli TaxID=1979269 RepID=A0A437M142_9PROT|nr:phage Gp37/Gp68 family protein [Rhodovarius crocodyli]RVT91439.1 phage Gp37/Gp68 family protein [Rhodovarius crocodyli]